jgi:hypothetical protein
LVKDGTITISDGEVTDTTANHLRVDIENAGKLGKVLVALAAALGSDSSRDGDGTQSEAGRTGDEADLLRVMAAGLGTSDDQLAMIDSLVSRGARREDFKTMTPDRFAQLREAWQQIGDRINETQCVACGKTFTYERMGRPPLTCSAECRRERNSKAQVRRAD